MQPVNIYEAKARLSELVQRAADGEEIIIARNGRPMARLVPLAPRPRRGPGGWEGKVWMAPDLDAADEEIARMLLGEESEEER